MQVKLGMEAIRLPLVWATASRAHRQPGFSVSIHSRWLVAFTEQESIGGTCLAERGFWRYSVSIYAFAHYGAIVPWA